MRGMEELVLSKVALPDTLNEKLATSGQPNSLHAIHQVFTNLNQLTIFMGGLEFFIRGLEFFISGLEFFMSGLVFYDWPGNSIDLGSLSERYKSA